MRKRSLVPWPLLLLLGAWPAHAADFVPETGKLAYLPGEAGLRFEPGELANAELGLVLFDLRGRRLDAADVEALVTVDPDQALEGEAVLRGGAEAPLGRIDLRALSARVLGRRIEMRVWQRSHGSRYGFWLGWFVGDVTAYVERDDSDGVDMVGSLSFQPTGRVTDDGWEEWTSGPFDAWLGEALPPIALSFFDEATFGVRDGVADYDPGTRVELDGLSVIDLGAALVTADPCRLASEGSCGEAGTCYFGRCTDAATVLGAEIQEPSLRADYLARLAHIFQVFEGGRVPAMNAAALPAAFSAIPAGSARRFRDGIAAQIYALGDGHASPPVASFARPPSAGICAYLGLADQLTPARELPLVFEVDATSPAGAGLEPGDALETIDGLSPAAWAELARPRLTYGGDPTGRWAIEASMLVDAALRAGSELGFVRCTRTSSSGPAACSEGELARITVDLAARTEELWRGELLPWMSAQRTCDFRLRRPVEVPQARDYAFAGVATEDGVRMLQVNGVPARQWQGGQAWFDAVDSAFADTPTRVLLDERLGGGGSPDAVDQIAAYLVAAEDFFAMELYPAVDGTFDEDVRQRFLTCQEEPVIGLCGEGGVWTLGGFNPNVGAAAGARLAVVNGLDVSGNDFLPRLLTFRSAALRMFGPGPTFGAFGAVTNIPGMAGEYFGGSFQVQDTLFLGSAAETERRFHTSFGVVPDERVLQRQSDARRGVDTVLERAKAWVME